MGAPPPVHRRAGYGPTSQGALRAKSLEMAEKVGLNSTSFCANLSRLLALSAERILGYRFTLYTLMRVKGLLLSHAMIPRGRFSLPLTTHIGARFIPSCKFAEIVIDCLVARTDLI